MENAVLIAENPNFIADNILTELSHNKNKGINLHAGVCI